MKTRQRIIRISLAVVFLACVIYANFYAVWMIQRYGMEIYFYDKLLVAYDIGGKEGMEKELAKIISTERWPRELALAREFHGRLGGLKDPEGFLRGIVAEKKAKALFIKNLRTTAVILILAIFLWRLGVNLSGRFKLLKKRGF